MNYESQFQEFSILNGNKTSIQPSIKISWILQYFDLKWILNHWNYPYIKNFVLKLKQLEGALWLYDMLILNIYITWQRGLQLIIFNTFINFSSKNVIWNHYRCCCLNDIIFWVIYMWRRMTSYVARFWQ